jgi:hypothetical protein
MYVAKFHRNGVKWTVTLFEKSWSKAMLTHEVQEISSKNFVFHSSAYRWINKEISKHLFTKHELEIIDG